RLGITHPGVDLGEMDCLELDGASPSKFLIEMLPGPAKGLPGAERLLAEPLAMGALGLTEERFVEAVAILGDMGKQGREGDFRPVATRAIAAGSGRHEYG